MKKLLALFLVLTLALAFAACNRADYDDTKGKPETTETEDDKTSATTEEDTIPWDETNEVTTDEDPETAEPASLYFYNDTLDGRWNENAVSVVPKEVYFDEDTLVLHCYIVNGFSTNATGVSITDIKMYDTNGILFADGAFNRQNLAIEGLSYVEHTFTFGPDTCTSDNVDLSTLRVTATYEATH